MTHPRDSRSMSDFEVRQTPALDAHVLRHDRRAFRFDLAHAIDQPGIWGAPPTASVAIEEGREHKSVAMTVGPNQQHGSADSIETYASAAAQVVHVQAAVIAPGVEVEGPAAIFRHAVRMD